MVRIVVAWALLLASWLVGIDSMARAIWSWAKLGSFGYHVPWLLVGALIIVGAVVSCMFCSRKPRALAIAFGPVALLLIARHYP